MWDLFQPYSSVVDGACLLLIDVCFVMFYPAPVVYSGVIRLWFVQFVLSEIIRIATHIDSSKWRSCFLYIIMNIRAVPSIQHIKQGKALPVC